MKTIAGKFRKWRTIEPSHYYAPRWKYYDTDRQEVTKMSSRGHHKSNKGGGVSARVKVRRGLIEVDFPVAVPRAQEDDRRRTRYRDSQARRIVPGPPRSRQSHENRIRLGPKYVFIISTGQINAKKKNLEKVIFQENDYTIYM